MVASLPLVLMTATYTWAQGMAVGKGTQAAMHRIPIPFSARYFGLTSNLETRLGKTQLHILFLPPIHTLKPQVIGARFGRLGCAIPGVSHLTGRRMIFTLAT